MGNNGFSALPSGDPAGPLHTEREIRYRPHTARVYASGRALGQPVKARPRNKQDKERIYMGNNETARQKQYQQRVNEKMPRRNIALQCLRAFVSGGLICCIGQAVRDFGERSLALQGDDVAAFTSIVMVFLGATLTGLGGL